MQRVGQRACGNKQSILTGRLAYGIRCPSRSARIRMHSLSCSGEIWWLEAYVLVDPIEKRVVMCRQGEWHDCGVGSR